MRWRGQTTHETRTAMDRDPLQGGPDGVAHADPRADGRVPLGRIESTEGVGIESVEDVDPSARRTRKRKRLCAGYSCTSIV